MSTRRTPAAIVTAVFLPPFAWFLFQQGLAFSIRLDCTTGGPPVGPIAGLLALLLCGAAAWLAIPAARGKPAEAMEAPVRFFALAALGIAAVFAMAIGLQALATLLEPPCVR